MPEREREGASGPGGTPARESGASLPEDDLSPRHVQIPAASPLPQRARRVEDRPPPPRARRAMARLVVTPTFLASASIVIVAILAYGTTRTHLLYSGLGPACASASCTNTSPQASGGAPNAASAKQGTKAGQGSDSGRNGGSSANHASGGTGQPGSSPGGQDYDGTTGGQPDPVATAGAGPSRSRVVIVYRTLRSVRGGFYASITISNRGKILIRGWQLWMHYRSSHINRVAGARWFPDGAKAHDTGLAVPEPDNATLRPGATIRFTIQSSGVPGAPDGCVFDGNHCSFTH